MKVKDYLNLLKESRSKIQLRLCEVEDADFILSARLNEHRNKHLSETSTSLDNQKLWLEDYKKREAADEEHYFVVLAGEERVGLVRMYGYRGKEFCWGSWIILPQAPTSTAYTTAMLVYEIGFYVLGMESSYFDVRIENSSVWKFHERCGASLKFEDDKDRHYTFHKSDYILLREKWSKFLPIVI